MLAQVALGAAITTLGLVLSGLAFWAFESTLRRGHRRLMRRPRPLRVVAVTVGVSLLVLAVLSAGIWLWALAFLALGVFPSVEEALYYAIVAYTTLGLGDVVPPEHWRVLGAMAAANGFLNIGLLTSLLVEGLRAIREEAEGPASRPG